MRYLKGMMVLALAGVLFQGCSLYSPSSGEEAVVQEQKMQEFLEYSSPRHTDGLRQAVDEFQFPLGRCDECAPLPAGPCIPCRPAPDQSDKIHENCE